MKKNIFINVVLSLLICSCASKTEGVIAEKSFTGISQNFKGTDYIVLPSGTNGSVGTDSIYVLFGDWPQSEKSADITIDETEKENIGMFTYYKGKDDFWYAKVQEKYYKVEPIKWRIVTENYKGKKLLFCESTLINCQWYDYYVNRIIKGKEIIPNNYEHSKIRAFLNGLSYTVKPDKTSEQIENSDFLNKGFLQTAFTPELQKRIETTIVDNSRSSIYENSSSVSPKANDNPGCANTKDKIFLLSEKEVTTLEFGFEDLKKNGLKSSRFREPTAFAIANGSSYDGFYPEKMEGFKGLKNDFCWWRHGGFWWSRSPEVVNKGSARNVRNVGDADDAYNVGHTSLGVVPALTIKN